MYQLNPEKEQDINNIFILTSYFNIGKIFLKCDITHKTYFIQLFYIGFYIFISHGKMEIELNFGFSQRMRSYSTFSLPTFLSVCRSFFDTHLHSFIHTTQSDTHWSYLIGWTSEMMRKCGMKKHDRPTPKDGKWWRERISEAPHGRSILTPGCAAIGDIFSKFLNHQIFFIY